MELEAYLRFGLALLFVLGLIGLCAWGAKRLGMTPRVSAGAGRARRLAIVEVAAVDAKRRLVLVRRDDREHLLLLGAAQDVVVESGIAAPAAELAT
jgi:flagellar protein FliO/FliZ